MNSKNFQNANWLKIKINGKISKVANVRLNFQATKNINITSGGLLAPIMLPSRVSLNFELLEDDKAILNNFHHWKVECQGLEFDIVSLNRLIFPKNYYRMS